MGGKEKMQKYYKERIREAIDFKAGLLIEESGGAENEKELKKKAEILRRELRDIVTSDTFTDEFKITDEEWTEIYLAIAQRHPNLLTEFGIRDGRNLEEFIGLLSFESDPYKQFLEHPGRALHEGIIPTERETEYLKELVRAKTPSTGVQITDLFLYPEVIAHIATLPQGKEILLDAARLCPQAIFGGIEKGRLPLIEELLKEAVYFYAGKDRHIIMWLSNAEADGTISTMEKKALLEVRKVRHYNEALAKILLGIKERKIPHLTEEVAGLEKLEADVKKELEKLLKSVDDFLQDRSLREMANVNPDWFPEEIQNWQLLPKTQMRAMVARNLYIKGLPINEDNVRAECNNILEMRQIHANIPLFRNRNIVAAAHHEYKGERIVRGMRYDATGKPLPAFMENALVRELQRQQEEGNFSLIRPERNLESLRQAKREILEKISQTPPPFTFIFSGHGGPDAIYLSEGQLLNMPEHVMADHYETEKTIKITATELATALIERGRRFPELMQATPERRDIFIFMSCYNANFIRNLQAAVGKEGPQPTMIGSGEYGLMVSGLLGGEYDESLAREVMQIEQYAETAKKRRCFLEWLGIKGDRRKRDFSTIGDIFSYEFRSESEPSVYIPGEENRPIQISKQTKTEEREAIA